MQVGLGEKRPELFNKEPLLLFLLVSFVQDLSGALKFDGTERGSCVVDDHAVVLRGLVRSAATSHAAGMSLPDAIRFGIYDSGSDDDDNLVLEDNDVQE
eukprot:3544964-Pleurochrysis_carterae.AAC.1